MCGDAPAIAEGLSMGRTSFPHVRGCTVEVLAEADALKVLHPYAGMHPSSCWASSRRRYPSRMCGDAPVVQPTLDRAHDSFPRVRGCTMPCGQLRKNVAHAVSFPADAGIHLHRQAYGRRSCCPSRMCGDAPGSGRGPITPAWSFPAHAGMHPRSSSCRRARLGPSRMCGDPPDAGTTLTGHATSFPHMRGYAQDLQIGRPSARRPSRICGDAPIAAIIGTLAR